MQTINLRGQEFSILFDVNVMQQVQKRYGEVSVLSEKLRDWEEMKWIISILISEGQEYEAFMLGKTARKITPEQAGMLLSSGDFYDGKISQAVVDAFNESLGEGKNLTAEDLTMIANSTLATKMNA